MIRATFEPFTDRQKRTITEAFARPDIYDYLAKLAKKLHRTQKEIIYQARELGISDEYEQAKADNNRSICAHGHLRLFGKVGKEAAQNAKRNHLSGLS